jgi:hypothetical protein
MIRGFASGYFSGPLQDDLDRGLGHGLPQIPSYQTFTNWVTRYGINDRKGKDWAILCELVAVVILGNGCHLRHCDSSILVVVRCQNPIAIPCATDSP